MRKAMQSPAESGAGQISFGYDSAEVNVHHVSEPRRREDGQFDFSAGGILHLNECVL